MALIAVIIIGAMVGMSMAVGEIRKSGKVQKKSGNVESLKVEEQKDEIFHKKTADTANTSGNKENAAAKRNVENTATEADHLENGLPICMYHYVYKKENVPEDLNNNYIEQSALREELEYLVKEGYFFPTWEEVRAYLDGDLLLPKKSIVLTFDDGAKSFLKNGLPLFEEYQIPVTSFLITSKDGAKKVKKYSNPYLTWQSHSDNMHRPGGNVGHGGIFPALSVEEAVADLQKSIDICGSGKAFAYPFGDYTDSCVEAVEKAGFLCAVTTEYGKCKPGDNPFLLPRVRMLGDQSLKSFISAIN